MFMFNESLKLKLPVVDLTTLKFCGVAVVLYTLFSALRHDPYKDVPVIGSSSPIWSYVDGFQFLWKGQDIVRRGYRKYQKEGIFRFATPVGWMVIIVGRKYIEELRSKKDDELSASPAIRQVVSGDYTFGSEIFDREYHVPIVRTSLTRNINNFFDDVNEEIKLTIDDYFPVSSNGSEWKALNILTFSQHVVARASNRIYVSDPAIYREPDYLKTAINFVDDTNGAGILLRFFPDLIKPIVTPCLTNVPAAIKRGMGYLSDNISERLEMTKKYGKTYPGKKNDVLSWFIDMAEEQDRNVRGLTLRILHLNSSAIFTTSTALYIALMSLITHPECVEPLRDEIESVVSEHGWTKASMGRLHKMDSFLMEATRIHTLYGVTSPRLAMVDYTFSNGMSVPKGAFIAVASTARQLDENIFPEPHKFDGFRFCENANNNNNNNNNNEKQGQSINTSTSSKLTTLSSPDLLLFGLGEHACPGRFFAAHLLKLTLSHILFTYDIKLDSQRPPKPRYFCVDFRPGVKDVLLFRPRQNL